VRRRAAALALAGALALASLGAAAQPADDGGPPSPMPAAAEPAASAPALTAADVTPRVSAAPTADLCRKARRGDAEAAYQLAWIYAHGRGADRRDDWASYLFLAASIQGHTFARKMLNTVTWPMATVPSCFLQVDPASRAVVQPSIVVRAPAHIEKMVQRLAPQFKVDPQLALTIIAVESNFDAYAVSRSSAMGLMQLIPQTAKRFGVRNAFDAQQNVRGGMAYLRWLLAYYQGDVSLVAAAYNAGEGAVDRHKGIPPFAETQEYVKRVVARFGSAPHPYDAKAATPSVALGSMRTVGAR
jgi:soluble lytic murein transglycosylase-like protein